MTKFDEAIKRAPIRKKPSAMTGLEIFMLCILVGLSALFALVIGFISVSIWMGVIEAMP